MIEKTQQIKEALKRTTESTKIIIDGTCLNFLISVRKDLRKAAKKLENKGTIQIVTVEIADSPKHRNLINRYISKINNTLKRKVLQVHHLRNNGPKSDMMHYCLVDQKQCYFVQHKQLAYVDEPGQVREYINLFESIWRITPPEFTTT